MSLNPVLIGLVEAAKALGLSTRLAPALSVALGLIIQVALPATAGTPSQQLVEALIQGAALGLSAAGLYDVVHQASRLKWAES